MKKKIPQEDVPVILAILAYLALIGLTSLVIGTILLLNCKW